MRRTIILTLMIFGFILAKAQNVDSLLGYYLKGELNRALEISTELIGNNAENAGYNQLHGRILTDLGKYNDALPYLNKAVALDNSKTDISGWALGYLGQCYFMLGQYEDARISFNKCIKLGATENSVKYAKKRLFTYGFDKYFTNWKIVETSNIRFHIQNPKGYSNLNAFIAQRENAFIEVSNTLKCKPTKKIDYFVWENEEEPYKKFNMKLGFADPLNACIYSLKKQTAGHEITHVISHYIGKNPIKTGLINEGLATYFNMENDNKLENLKKVLKAKDISNLKVIDVWNSWNTYSFDITYPLAGAFMEALIEEYGIEKLFPLFVNQTYENALALFGEDINRFIGDFESKIVLD